MTEILAHLAGQPVIVGSGIAGLMAALSFAPQPVVLITSSALGQESSSALAQGGIAASLGADDSVDRHVADTLAASDGLCEPTIVASIASEAPALIATLEAFGAHFDRDAFGAIALGLEAAHSCSRIVHARGDSTGAEIVRALTRAVSALPSLSILAGFEARRLLLADGAIGGLLCTSRGRAYVLPTPQVLLATGGVGGLYHATTNPTGNFGQGIALAARAGAELADMEFVQFHPTALKGKRRPLALVSEAVRGEGAILVNARGERFMADVPAAELASRDVVARAIDAEIAHGGSVFLDVRKTLGDRFARRFPGIDALCRNAGIDPGQQLIPVVPAVHYHMGGVATDAMGRTSVSGLWAAGEVASTGLHGANRLASNSLLEAAVMGMRAASDMSASVQTLRPLAIEPLPPQPDPTVVRHIMERHLGLRRSAGGIGEAVDSLRHLVETEGPASNPAIVGLLIATFAALRTESRGAHTRSDFPLKQASAKRRRLTLAQALNFARDIQSGQILRSASA